MSIADAPITIAPDPVLDRAPSEDDRDHIACCRDFLSDGPIVALCGFVGETERRVFSDHLCRRCTEEARTRLRALGHHESANDPDLEAVPSICLWDGSSCPDGAEAEAVLRKILGL